MNMPFDLKIFLNKTDDMFSGKFSGTQISGLEAILNEWSQRKPDGDLRWLAYMLATAFHETAQTMQPVREAFWLPEKWREKNLPYYPYYGRGYVQLTHRENYVKAGKVVGEDLAAKPDLALNAKIASVVMFVGMEEGWFRESPDGKRHTLSRYFSIGVDDPVGARKIINGKEVKKIGGKKVLIADVIAGYHIVFLEALEGAAVKAVPGGKAVGGKAVGAGGPGVSGKTLADHIAGSSEADPVTTESDTEELAFAAAKIGVSSIRIGSRGALVRAWQSFLEGRNIEAGEPDGVFGDKTDAATRTYQTAEGLTVDGIAGRQTFVKAMMQGFQLVEEPAVDMSGTNFPPKPNFPPLVGTLARQAVFGKFAYVHAPLPQNKENIRILGSWEADNIVTVKIPQLVGIPGAPGSGLIRFHRLAAGQLQGLWQAWEASGLLDRVLSYSGSFVPRFIRGSTKTLSNHAFGSAFDINVPQNSLGATPALVGQNGSVRELVPLANEWGFYWGGHFNTRLDGMHFEIAFIK